MYRGRLINPFTVVIARLDTVQTRNVDPDGAGELTGGFDDVFREPHVVDGGGGARVSVREEQEVSLPAQIEDRVGEQLRPFPSGDSPAMSMQLTLHFKDLEAAGLVGSDGVAAIHKRDRLVEIRDPKTNDLIQSYRGSPGLYVVEVTPAGFGIGLKRNLLLVRLEQRDIATAAVG